MNNTLNNSLDIWPRRPLLAGLTRSDSRPQVEGRPQVEDRPGLTAEDDRGGGAELLVEILSETPDQRFLQELIHTDAFAPALLERIGTDIPVMHIKREIAGRELLDTDRIKCTRDRLAERTTALEETPLDSAQTVAVLEKSISALLGAWNKRRHRISLEINLEETLGFSGITPALRHQMRIMRILPLEDLNLILLHRSTAVAYDAALALALLIITREKLCKHLLGHEAVIYLDDCTETVVCHKNQ